MRKLLGFFFMMTCLGLTQAMAQGDAKVALAGGMTTAEAAENNTVTDNKAAAPTDASATAPAAAPSKPAAYNFGDFRSSTLVGKAWQALAKNDIEAVLAYTGKCIDLYAAKAKEMQASLKDYVTGSNDDIFKYWALNDVATAYYIQGEAYRQANMKDESKEAFNKVVNEFSFGQCWDTKGWFWKPAEDAKEKLAK